MYNRFGDEMSPLEREEAYARGERVDRQPMSLSMNETVPPMYGMSLADYYFSAEKMVEIEDRMIEDFGVDNTCVNIGLRCIGEALGSTLQYPIDRISYIDRPILTDYGQLDNMELCDMHKDGTLPVILEAAKMLQDKYGSDRSIGAGISAPVSTAVSIVGTDRFLRDMRRNPEGVHKLLEFSSDCIVECARVFWEEAGAGTGFCEPIGSRDLLSLPQCKEFLIPYLRDVNQRITDICGFPPSFHMCGHTRDRWEVLRDSGIGSFSVDNCESLLEAKEVMGPKVPIYGNVPPVEVVYRGTAEEIEKDVVRCLSQGADSPSGYTVCGGCQMPIGTPRENIEAYFAAVRKYGRGARKGCLPEGLAEAQHLL